MNAKSKFSIPILSGTRPEVGLFSATVAAPSLRNASNLVAGVAVSSYPMVTTGVTSNNSTPIYASNDNSFNYLGDDGTRVCYPGTNALLAVNGNSNLLYLNSNKKTIQLDDTQDVTGAFTSDMMVTYLKTGKMEGEVCALFDNGSVFATATNSTDLDPQLDQSELAISLVTELYDCSPKFSNVSNLEVTTQGANYTLGTATVRMVYFADENRVIGSHPSAYVVGNVTSGGVGAISNPTAIGQALINTAIENIPVGATLTVEDGQVTGIGALLTGGGSGYPPSTTVPLACKTKVVVPGVPSSSVSQEQGQGLLITVNTDATGAISAVVAITDSGSGYSAGDIVELIFEGFTTNTTVPDEYSGSGAVLAILTADKTPSTGSTLATVKVTEQFLPGKGAPIGPYDSYTVESIKLPNGQIKNLALNSEENICQSKVPKARIFTAGGARAYYPQISSGLQPTNWNSGVGAALCANPTLCLPVGIGRQNGQTIVNGVPV